jgi:hypothetical protein
MKNLVYTLLILILLFGCTPRAKIISEEYKSDNLLKIVIDSPSLNNSMIDELTKKDVYVLLPPGYNTSQKKYPVVYYLHGFGGGPFEIVSFIDEITGTMASGEIGEFIIVGVTGSNKLNGSFFVNSKVTGS